MTDAMTDPTVEAISRRIQAVQARYLQREQQVTHYLSKDLAAAQAEVAGECLAIVREVAARPLSEQVRQAATDGPNELAAVVGKWPGDETDEEIEAALAEL